MADAPHVLLWRRVREALAVRDALASGHPTETEIAAHAKAQLRTDVVQRFVQQYYAPREYGDGEDALSDDEARRLVQELEALPLAAASASQPHSGSAARGATDAAISKTPLSPVKAEATLTAPEAVAYGEDEERAERRGRVTEAWRKAEEERRAREISTAEAARRAAEAARLAEEEKRRRETQERRRAEAEWRQLEDAARRAALAAANRAERVAADDRKAAAARSKGYAGAPRAAPGADDMSAEDMDIVELYLRADAFRSNKNFDRAIADFDVLIKRSPLDFHFQGRGKSYLGQCNYERAIVDFDEAIRRTPDYFFFYLERAEAHLGKGAVSEALRDCDKAVQLQPRDQITLEARGKVYHRMGNLDRALADYGETIAVTTDHDKPAFAVTLFNRGAVLHEKRDYHTAIEDYGRAIVTWQGRKGSDQYVALACNARGCAKHELQDYDGAIADYGESIRFVADYRDPWVNRGRAYCDRGEYGPALADYTQAIQLDENDVDAHYGCAIALRRTGDEPGADRQLAIARKIDSEIERRRFVLRRRSMLT